MKTYPPKRAVSSLRRNSPWYFLLWVILSVFCAETSIMLLFLVLPKLPELVECFIDSTLLSVLIAPSLYFFLYRPLVEQIVECDLIEKELRESSAQSRQQAQQLELALRTELMQSEKMSSLGRMLAGVAHEINNPVNFIYGNLVHAINYVNEILTLLSTYEAEISNPPKAVQVRAQEIDIEFLKQDLPKLLQSMQVGADRVKQIVLALKNFSRLDETEAHSVDLHACIDSTLLILNNRIKKGITLVRHYGKIPLIEGYTGLLYQVFMNLLSNALDALEEKAPSSSCQEIVISTQRQDKDWVVVRIADNGPGMTPENQAKIFDAFFTTKPRGMGTGLGLAISHEIVVEKHGGKITCFSDPDRGTEFAIALPIKHLTTSASILPISQPSYT